MREVRLRITDFVLDDDEDPPVAVVGSSRLPCHPSELTTGTIWRVEGLDDDADDPLSVALRAGRIAVAVERDKMS